MKSPEQLSDPELLALSARAQALPDAPPAWVDAAIGLWPSRGQSIGAALGSALRRVLAVLSFDSAATPGLALGLRGGALYTRHLLFAAEGRDIDLRIRSEDGAHRVQGQVLGPDTEAELWLRAEAEPNEPPRRTQLDDLGSFSFDAVPEGRYALTLRTPSEEIVLPVLDIGPTRR